ncbi:MAG TPA: permease-like cell division protein FtsX [Methylophilaceae bacterium]|nr:permease-like cell division protein FtsX [Methylophilaceae bacterium]HQR60758.1 permease-like cell division protein FtsX [Methylophilaceae bacterium]
MISQWLSQHRQSFRQVLCRMWRNRLATLMMLGVMGATLSLPALLYVAVDNLSRFSGDVRSEPQISLFVALDAKPEAIQDIGDRLRRQHGIRSYHFVPRDEAWQKLRQNAGLSDIADGLEQNPLPDAYIILPDNDTPEVIEQMQQEMQQWPEVAHAQLDTAWVKRLYSLVELGKKAVAVLAGLLGFALLAVIGNTIRLQILTQRDEIEVSALIGATGRFIRRPFLYAGALYGLGGGLVAWLFLWGVVDLFNLSVDDLARLYASDFRLQMPDWQAALALVGGAVGLGWLGAYWSASRALSDIDPL